VAHFGSALDLPPNTSSVQPRILPALVDGWCVPWQVVLKKNSTLSLVTDHARIYAHVYAASMHNTCAILPGPTALNAQDKLSSLTCPRTSKHGGKQGMKYSYLPISMAIFALIKSPPLPNPVAGWHATDGSFGHWYGVVTGLLHFRVVKFRFVLRNFLNCTV